MTAERINLNEALQKFDEIYSPRIVTRVNEYDVRIAHTKGEHVWHVHENTDESVLNCSFCTRAQSEGHKFVAGPGVYICERCVDLAGGVLATGQAAETAIGAVSAVPTEARRHQCSFCGRHRGQVTGIAATSVPAGGKVPGPVAICAECIGLCQEIIREQPV